MYIKFAFFKGKWKSDFLMGGEKSENVCAGENVGKNVTKETLKYLLTIFNHYHDSHNYYVIILYFHFTS